MDKNEVIRFRVESEQFVDQLPIPPHLKTEDASLQKPPYALIVRHAPTLITLVDIRRSCERRALIGSVNRLLVNRREWVWCSGGWKMRKSSQTDVWCALWSG